MSSKAQQLKAAGNAAFAAGNHSEAIKCFTDCIQEDPSDHVYYSNRSAAYAAVGDFTEAMNDAESCVKIAPTWAKGYSRKGLALFNLKKFEEAKKAYQHALDLEPDNAGFQEGLRDVEEAMNAPPPNPFGSLFGPDIWMKIQLNPRLAPFLQDQQFVNNVKLLQSNPSLISSMLSDPKIQILFGVLLGMGDQAFSAAGEQPEGGADREEPPVEKPKSQPAPEPKKEEPEMSEAQRNAIAEKEAGNAAYKKREFDAALSHYENALRLDPKNPVLLNNIAAVNMETFSYDEAIATCQKCVELCREVGGSLPVAAKAFARMGTAYQKKGDFSNAINCFERSLIEFRDRTVDKKLREAKKLKEDAEKESYLDEGKALEHKENGNTLFQAGKWVDAIKEYTESIQRNPKDCKVYSNRAACYTKLMDWGNALNDVNTAIALDSKFVKAYIRKGKIETFLKQYHKARETYQAGLALDPECSDLHEGLQEIDMAIRNENMSGDIDPERQARAMADPEVQKLLQDPQLQNVLTQIQNDPKLAQKAFNDPEIRKKLEVLIDAGVLRIK